MFHVEHLFMKPFMFHVEHLFMKPFMFHVEHPSRAGFVELHVITFRQTKSIE
jgi:hypothetical protein